MELQLALQEQEKLKQPKIWVKPSVSLSWSSTAPIKWVKILWPKFSWVSVNQEPGDVLMSSIVFRLKCCLSFLLKSKLAWTLKNKREENSFSLNKDKFHLKIQLDSSSLWILDMPEEQNFLITWKPCSDLALWSCLILFLFAKTCLCLKVLCLPKIFPRSLCLYICFQENFFQSKNIMIGVFEQSSLCLDKLVN